MKYGHERGGGLLQKLRDFIVEEDILAPSVDNSEMIQLLRFA